MLLEAKQDFMVIWGNVWKSKSQRYLCHNCCGPTLAWGHHLLSWCWAVVNCILSHDTWEHGFQLPLGCSEMAYRTLLMPSLGTSSMQPSPCSTTEQRHIVSAPALPKGWLPPCTPLQLHVLFLHAPSHKLKMLGGCL